MEMMAKDWTARILQHEVDHLNGTLITGGITTIYIQIYVGDLGMGFELFGALSTGYPD